MTDLNLIREKISLVTLAEESGAKFSDPHRLRSVCPLPRHAGDRTSQAFSIYEDGRKWKCHSSCPPDANSGDIFAFYMAWKEVDFKTAVTELAERCGQNGTHLSPLAPVSAPQLPSTPDPIWQARAEQFITWAQTNLHGENGEQARAYLEKERGLSPATQRSFRLGYNPQNLYDDPGKWGLEGKRIWLPRGIVIPGFWQDQPMYIKVRRPLQGDMLEHYLGNSTSQDGLPDIKFGGPRGGRSTLFRLEFHDHLPVLILTEGEWDAMLLWEHCADLCDVGTLGGAGSKFDIFDWSLLTRYVAVLTVYDDDRAGEEGRAYVAQLQARIPRLGSIRIPAHDLTDFWKSGGDLRAWTARTVADAMDQALQNVAQVPGRWKRVLAWYRRETG